MAGQFRPNYLAIDAAGRVYTTDCLRARVFRIENAGDRAEVVVGSGPGFANGFAGDGGPAIEARIECPFGLAFDAAGNLFVADHSNNRIRVVDDQGIIETVVGSGPAGLNLGAFGGDGGPAIEALLQEPAGIAFDAAGNLYIADRDNDRIRMVDLDGIITTIAGDGRLFPTYSGDGGPAVEASLRLPQGIAVDAAGNIYFADSGNNRLRMIDTDGIIVTIAGTGTRTSSGDGGPALEAELADPRAVALDGAGNIYVSESGRSGKRVRRVDAGGLIHPFAATGALGFWGDGGAAIDAKFLAVDDAFGLAVDGAGNVYIADGGNQRIRMVDRSGTITTFADGN